MQFSLKFAQTSAFLLSMMGAAIVGCHGPESQHQHPRQATVGFSNVETTALAFLQREVPKWPRENGCFSCHNNGDAARALFAAARLGYPVPKAAVADTILWLNRPDTWSNNQGDPGFSDQRLADIQFAAALQASLMGMPKANPSQSATAVRKAALRVAAGQDADGSWRIEPQNPVGSPATYGTALATYIAWKTLRGSEVPGFGSALDKAAQWLRQLVPSSVPAATVIVMASVDQGLGTDGAGVGAAIEFLKRAQTQSGGWGPYPDGPPEVFDTALALLALSRLPGDAHRDLLKRGRDYLAATQLPDGSWPATTRPSGGASYAQEMSTTGWATLALLLTRENVSR